MCISWGIVHSGEIDFVQVKVYSKEPIPKSSIQPPGERHGHSEPHPPNCLAGNLPAEKSSGPEQAIPRLADARKSAEHKDARMGKSLTETDGIRQMGRISG